MGTVKITARWLRPMGDGDAEEISSDVTEFNCVPDEFDIEDGLTPVDLAVKIIRERYFISGPYCASSYPGWGGPHTWYQAEPYEHPYEDKYEEVSASLDGWTDAESHEIWAKVTAKSQ